jgi:hypothetical protein
MVEPTFKLDPIDDPIKQNPIDNRIKQFKRVFICCGSSGGIICGLVSIILLLTSYIGIQIGIGFIMTKTNSYTMPPNNMYLNGFMHFMSDLIFIVGTMLLALSNSRIHHYSVLNDTVYLYIIITNVVFLIVTYITIQVATFILPFYVSWCIPIISYVLLMCNYIIVSIFVFSWKFAKDYVK